ncbi:MAG TPA: HD domain-containing phosphohydrolase [Candidatus Wunengus sp. YC64]|uniref:HD domain-containing phosphohydrolase n=1 Tax=Candidatus Wunengus sp. YC64 TaxID=3367700 RepID=UPI0027136836|nr:HD domain-containing phosphohydrolase [Candidatus Brocadiales bacterium]
MEISKVVYKLMEDEMMRLLLSDVTDLTYIYDTNGNILFVNKIFEKFTGQRPEEFYGKPFISLFNEEDQKKVTDAYTKTLNGVSTQYELCFKNTGVLCEYKNFPLRNEKGHIVGVTGIARDITARKQIEEGLRVLNTSLEKRVVEHTEKLVEVNEELMEEINNRIRQEEEFKQSIKKLQKSLSGIVQTLALAIESKDSYAIGHQKRVARLVRCIAEEMGLSKDRIEGVSIAAILHDIGNISVPTELLNKSDRLSEDEVNIIKTHPRVGYDILNEMEFPHPIAQIVLQHHERVDGSGYPLGLSGKDILLEAKILGVADVIDAMLSPHPYRPALGLDKALDEVSRNRGILYDFNVVYACLVVFNEKGFKYNDWSRTNLRIFEDVLLSV